MKIYKLTVNQIEPSTSSSAYLRGTGYSLPVKTEYFLLKQKAEERASAIYTGVKDLIGIMPDINVKVTEIEVIE